MKDISLGFFKILLSVFKRSDLVHWEDLEGVGGEGGWGTHVNPWLFHFKV